MRRPPAEVSVLRCSGPEGDGSRTVDPAEFPSAPPREAILTREQTARWLQMSVRSLDRSPIPRVKVGTRVRYSVEAVLEWIRKGGSEL